MDNTVLLGHLEELAYALGIKVRYEKLEGDLAFTSGGLCRIRNEPVFIINVDATTEEKVRTFARALRRFDLSQIYLKPALRDFLEMPSE